jgi:gliding motility-associated-like protein
VKNWLALFLLLFCLTGKSQTPSLNSGKAKHHKHDDGEKPLFNWSSFISSFSLQLNISDDEANRFFGYAQNNGLVDMADYRDKIKNKIIDETNALHYWLNKIPEYRTAYNDVYLPYLKTVKNTTSSNKNSVPNTTQGSCNNLDFSSASCANWSGQWSDVPNSGGMNAYGPLDVTGINTNGSFNDMGYVHEVCTPNTDRNVPISTVPPGHTHSLRLGDDSAYIMNVLQTSTGNSSSFPYNHQTISNTFLVTAANKIITYWYAVALSQSTTQPHNQPEQPFFKIRMYTQSGTEILCARYDVDATTASTIGGFQSITDPTGNNEFLYKDWSQVVIPLQNYLGQNVTITFETCDCALGGHFGYSYIAVDCAPFPGITYTPFVCGMTSTTMTAPPGVASYSWTGPGIVGSHTGQTVTVSTGGHYTVNMTTLGNGGTNCTLTLDTIIPGVPPTPATTFSTLPVCVGNPTVFGGIPPGVYNYLMWDFGDGIKDSSNATPTHTYAAPGTYTVTFTLSNGCPGTHTAVVNVYPGATASFNAAPVCKGTPTVFNNTSTGGSTYDWNFADATPHSSGLNPNHTYSNAGTYAVTLVVTNTAGCQFVATNTVVVNVMPVAQFSGPVACLGVTTNFNNTSTPATNVNYHWDFGNLAVTNDTSAIKNPSYTYNAIGTYTVLLQLNTPAGCSSSVTHTVVVNPIPAMGLVTPVPYCWNDLVPQPVYTVNPNSPAMTYGWVNSNTQIGLNGAGSGIPPAFTAGMNTTTSNISGVVTVVPTLNGCSGPPATYTITIKPTPVVTHPNDDYCPNATTNAISFTVSPPASSIVWINTTPGTNIGLTTMNGTSFLPSFTALDTGNTMVSNVISLQGTLNGCVGPLSTFSINVNPNPVASFTNSTACDGAGTTFYDLSTVGTGSVSQWGWDFNNDGSYNDAITKNPTTILTPVGTHTVNLVVTTNKGCSDYVTQTVYVSPRPYVSFSGDTLSGCNPVSVNFSDTCTVPLPDVIVKWVWDFGNGTSQTDTTAAGVMITYTNGLHASPLSFNVSLTAITSAGCVTKITKMNYIKVFPIPLAGFDWGPKDADMLDPMVQFQNQAQGANFWHWDFGDVYNTYFDNDTSTQVNPKHQYSDQLPYTYYVTQIVTNTYGCADTVVEPVIIKPLITFYIPNAFSPNLDGKNDGFKGTGVGINLNTYNLWIFDRWGSEIFHSNDLEETWNGKYKGVTCQEDTYVWKVTFTDIINKDHAYKGVVNIIR